MAEVSQTRIVELIVSEVKVPSPCCSCRKKDGVLKCSGCKAVTYCGKECQEKGWNHHRQICNAINQLLQDVQKAIQDLATEYGGVEALLEAPLVREGLFTFRDNVLRKEDESNNHRLTLPEKYDMARWKLIEAYAKCGNANSSSVAFRLAVENLIHMLRLSRNGRDQELPAELDANRKLMFHGHKYCGWMVAGGMDQQALNFLCYSREPSRSLYLDLSVDEDIEGVSVINIVKEKTLHYHDWTLKMWFQDFMLISLIKYKRIQALEAQRKEEVEQWNAFMEGTQSVNGDSSVVSMLIGMVPVLEKLKGYVVDKSVDERVNILTHQVNDMLIAVNETNPKLVPGILDRQILNDPTFPLRDELGEFLSHDSEFERFRNSGFGVKLDGYNARYAANRYGYAWLIDDDCTKALRQFTETGTFTTGKKDIPETVHQNEMEGKVEVDDKVKEKSKPIKVSKVVSDGEEEVSDEVEDKDNEQGMSAVGDDTEEKDENAKSEKFKF